MSCKIYNLSSNYSAPPYFINGYEDHLTRSMCIWKDKKTHWREIGEVPSIEIARAMVTKNLSNYTDKDGKEYSLLTEPSDEYYCSFAKIESQNITEYYDAHNSNNEFQLRNLDTVSLNYDFSTGYAFEKLRNPIWKAEKSFNQWRRFRQNFSVIFEHRKFSKKDRQKQKKYAADFKDNLQALISRTELTITLLKKSRTLEKFEIERINEILHLYVSTFALICTGHNDYPYRDKKNISLREYKKILTKLFRTVEYYNSHHLLKINSWKTIHTELTKRWNFLQTGSNEKSIKNATQKLVEKNLKLKELFSDVEKESDSLISLFWEWKELHSPDDFTLNDDLPLELQNQEDSQFQKINSTIHIIEQQTDQIFSVALSFVVIDPLNYKEIENSFFAITLAINTFVGLYQNNIDKYQKLSKINIKSLKKSKTQITRCDRISY